MCMSLRDVYRCVACPPRLPVWPALDLPYVSTAERVCVPWQSLCQSMLPTPGARTCVPWYDNDSALKTHNLTPETKHLLSALLQAGGFNPLFHPARPPPPLHTYLRAAKGKFFSELRQLTLSAAPGARGTYARSRVACAGGTWVAAPRRRLIVEFTGIGYYPKDTDTFANGAVR